MELLDFRRLINLSTMTIKHMVKVADTDRAKHPLPFKFLLTGLLDKFNMAFPDLKYGNHNDVLDILTLK